VNTKSEFDIDLFSFFLASRFVVFKLYVKKKISITYHYFKEPVEVTNSSEECKRMNDVNPQECCKIAEQRVSP
jgi:hypothetical protein